MKNIKIILYAFLSFVLTTSCTEDYEKLNENPNRSSEIPGHLLLGYTQRNFVNTLYTMQYAIGRGRYQTPPCCVFGARY